MESRYKRQARDRRRCESWDKGRIGAHPERPFVAPRIRWLTTLLVLLHSMSLSPRWL
jgi:hypothetical protein